ncbi:MAG: hypoxanthine phosphoribosyltransferase [Herpetosiphonaceae bacterium]|nr:hypoxanthine phosphoribosyltransferase [Herpetosiphonaceae bacterium]
MHPDVDHILISASDLNARVQALGDAITAAAGAVDELLLVGVLKGSVLFMADLIRAIDRPVAIDFIAVSSYGASTASSGVVRLIKDLDSDISGRHVVLVEDIVDSGLTLSYVVDLLKRRKPASVAVCALLNKPERREADINLDYVGFDIPNEFVVGYGLDYAERYRNLPYIGVLKPSVYGC